MDDLARYLEVFEALRARKRWTTDLTVLRFAALSLAATPLSDVAGRLEEAADELRQHTRWFDPLRSPLRYAIAAMILRRGRDVGGLVRQIGTLRESFRHHRLSYRGAHATLAALLLTLAGTRRDVVTRMTGILRCWREAHPWLTGGDDLPLAALHALRDTPVATIGHDVEEAYRSLRDAGFLRGGRLQLTSHLLAADPRGVRVAIQRFKELARLLRERGETIRSNRYDELAQLSLATSPVLVTADRVISLRDGLRSARPRPSKEIAFSLAAGLTLAEDATAALGKTTDSSELLALQAVLDVQQAASTAAMVAAISASAAAASG